MVDHDRILSCFYCVSVCVLAFVENFMAELRLGVTFRWPPLFSGLISGFVDKLVLH